MALSIELKRFGFSPVAVIEFDDTAYRVGDVTHHAFSFSIGNIRSLRTKSISESCRSISYRRAIPIPSISRFAASERRAGRRARIHRCQRNRTTSAGRATDMIPARSPARSTESTSTSAIGPSVRGVYRSVRSPAASSMQWMSMTSYNSLFPPIWSPHAPSAVPCLPVRLPCHIAPYSSLRAAMRHVCRRSAAYIVSGIRSLSVR